MKKDSRKPDNPQLISYITLRRAVGILGIAFPILLLAGSVCCGSCHEVQNSISSYYHTRMGDLFVGVLCAIALFLFAYKGYSSLDAMAGNLACLFALGVAFFPTSTGAPFTSCLPIPIDMGIISYLHYASAAGLFLTLAFFSIYLFTKGEKKPTRMKKRRNRLYLICGYLMLACIFLIALHSLLEKTSLVQKLGHLRLVFWLETIALWAFGLSWLVKGETLWTDEKEKN